MKKVDFTIKGTKLPVIPKGTEYSIVPYKNTVVATGTTKEDFISYGKYYKNSILAEAPNFINTDFCIFPLSTIEALAEEQGMLYDKEEEPTISLTPSLRDLLQQASVSEYIIRTGCQMFEGVDENHRLKQVEQEWAKLREVVNTLQTILNKK